MIQLKHCETTKHNAQQIFDLVADVEKYPEFLPWCAGARITKQISDTEFMAELIISFKGISESYTSRVTLSPNKAVRSELVKGPFKHLVNDWHFQEYNNEETEISLDLEFEFKSKLLNAMIGGVFAKSSEKMISAFRRRADELYS